MNHGSVPKFASYPTTSENSQKGKSSGPPETAALQRTCSSSTSACVVTPEHSTEYTSPLEEQQSCNPIPAGQPDLQELIAMDANNPNKANFDLAQHGTTSRSDTSSVEIVTGSPSLKAFASRDTDLKMLETREQPKTSVLPPFRENENSWDPSPLDNFPGRKQRSRLAGVPRRRGTTAEQAVSSTAESFKRQSSRLTPSKDVGAGYSTEPIHTSLDKLHKHQAELTEADVLRSRPSQQSATPVAESASEASQDGRKSRKDLPLRSEKPIPPHLQFVKKTDGFKAAVKQLNGPKAPRDRGATGEQRDRQGTHEDSGNAGNAREREQLEETEDSSRHLMLVGQHQKASSKQMSPHGQGQLPSSEQDHPTFDQEKVASHTVQTSARRDLQNSSLYQDGDKRKYPAQSGSTKTPLDVQVEPKHSMLADLGRQKGQLYHHADNISKQSRMTQASPTQSWENREAFGTASAEQERLISLWMQDNTQDEAPRLDTTHPDFVTGVGIIAGDVELQEGIEASLHDIQAPERKLLEPKRHFTAQKAINEKLSAMEKKSSLQKNEKTKEERRLSKAMMRGERADLEARENLSEHKPIANIYMRPAELKDADQIRDIFAYYVASSSATPYTEPLKETEWQDTIKECDDCRLPFVVAVLPPDKIKNRRDARRVKWEPIVGFAYAVDYGENSNAFRTTVESHVWVDHRYLRQGIGKTLMDRAMASMSASYAWRDPVPYFDDKSKGGFLLGGPRPNKTILISLLYSKDDAEDIKGKKAWLATIGFQDGGVIPNIGFKNDKM